MRYVVFILSLFIFPLSTAQDLVEFQNGQVADAEKINENFTILHRDLALESERLTSVESRVVSSLRNLSLGGGLKQTSKTNNYDGNENTALGFNALLQNKSGYRNTAVGNNALLTNESGSLNTAVGHRALEANVGFSNTALGARSLQRNSTGTMNTAVGHNSLSYNETGIENVAIGAAALQLNTTGEHNVAVGTSSQSSNETGIRNSSVGHVSLLRNQTGTGNSAFGWGALLKATAGDYNTALGYLAMYSSQTGSGNTAIGMEAFRYLKSGTNNTAMGYAAGTHDPEMVITNATAIGFSTKVNASNKVRIGNTEVTVIEGQVPFTSSSDQRLKEDIQIVDKGLDLINDLTPVSYKRINNKAGTVEMGLLAQDVAATLAKYGLSDSGMVHQANEDAYMSLRYNDLLAPMIKAIQELSEESKTLHAQTKSLKEKSKEKDETIAILENRLETQQQEMIALLKQQQDQIASLKRVVEREFVATSD